MLATALPSQTTAITTAKRESNCLRGEAKFARNLRTLPQA